MLWWFSGCDNEADRSVLSEERPYVKGPDSLGTFAARSPRRPNPIALSCAGAAYIDVAGGVVGLEYIDADDGSPVLNLKPYTPSLDRVGRPRVPIWGGNWPGDMESGGDFDWSGEFNS